MTHESDFNDQRLENIIGNLLRCGVLAAALIVLAGGVLFLAQHGGAHADYSQFQSEPENLRTLGGIFQTAFHGDPRGIMQLGLLLLIATPIARVLFSVLGFALERDPLYVVLTLIVFAILMYSLLHSL
jgi:uncharacterized membrane protein